MFGTLVGALAVDPPDRPGAAGPARAWYTTKVYEIS